MKEIVLIAARLWDHAVVLKYFEGIPMVQDAQKLRDSSGRVLDSRMMMMTLSQNDQKELVMKTCAEKMMRLAGENSKKGEDHR